MPTAAVFRDDAALRLVLEDFDFYGTCRHGRIRTTLRESSGADVILNRESYFPA
jgi:hypothetical protein